MSGAPQLEQALCALRDEQAARLAQASPAFAAQFEMLRAWQARKVAALHREHARANNGDALLHFLTDSFYLEADWSELIAQPAAVARRIGRIIHDPRPLVIAVRLQTSADALDAAMTRTLLEHAESAPLTRRSYVEAFRSVGEREQREQQIAWVDELVQLLAGYADNRTAYWAFKLAGAPARALGMARTYDLLAKGFATLRATRNLEGTTRDAIAFQRSMLDRLLTDDCRARRPYVAPMHGHKRIAYR